MKITINQIFDTEWELNMQNLDHKIPKKKELTGYTKCSLCGNLTLSSMAHFYQRKWIGHDCCWDERLLITE